MNKKLSDLFFFGLIFVLGCLLYVPLTSRFINFLDSGEFLVQVKCWGVAHPPGYPLMPVIYNFLNLFIPVKDFTFKCNLSSTLLNVLSLTVFSAWVLCIRRMQLAEQNSKRPDLLNEYLPVLMTTSILAVFPPFLLSGLRMEVYSMANLTLMLFIYLSTLAILKNLKFSKWAFLVLGIGLVVHSLNYLMIPVAAVVLVILLKNKDFKELGFSTGLFILGFSTYLIVFILSARNPYLNWEGVYNFKTFLKLLTREGFQHQTFDWFTQIGLKMRIVSGILSDFDLFFIPWILLPVVGGALIYNKLPKLLFYSIILFAVYWFVIPGLNLDYVNVCKHYDFQFFFMPFAGTIALFIGFSGWWLFDAIKQKAKYLKIVITIIICTLFYLSAQPWDYSMKNYRYAEDFGYNLIQSMNLSGSNRKVIFTKDDNSTFLLMYYKVIKRETDLIILPITLISSNWFIEQVKSRNPEIELYRYSGKSDDAGRLFDYYTKFKIVNREVNSRQLDIYTTFNNKVFDEHKFKPCGFLYSPDHGDIITDSGMDMPDKTLRIKTYKVNQEKFNEVFSLLVWYSEYLNNKGLNYFEKMKLEKAEKYFLKSFSINPDDLPTLGYLGRLYLEEREFDKSIKYFRKYIDNQGPDNLVRLLYLEALARAGKQYEFETEYQVLLEFFKDKSFFQIKLCSVLYKLNKLEKMKYLLNMIEGYEDQKILYSALIMIKQGNKASGMKLLEKVPEKVKLENEDYNKFQEEGI